MQLVQDTVKDPCYAQGREETQETVLEATADGPVKPEQAN